MVSAKNLFTAAAAGLALVLSVSVAPAQTRWDMPTPYAEGNFHTRNIAEFAKDVANRTNNSLQITVHPNQSLIRHADTKNAVRRGVVPIAEILSSRLEGDNPIYGVDSLPFLATGYDAAQKLYQAQKPFLQKLLEREGMMLLFSAPWPPQGIYAKRELTAIADLKGVKLRAFNKATNRLAELAGAMATEIEASDIPAAFATGRVDAMLASASTGAETKAWEFLTHYHDVQAWIPRNIVAVNKQAFDGLSEGERRALTEAAAAAEQRGWEMSKAEAKEKTELLAKNGVKVLPPSDQLRQGLGEIGRTLAEEWVRAAGDDGKAILDAFQKR